MNINRITAGIGKTRGTFVVAMPAYLAGLVGGGRDFIFSISFSLVFSLTFLINRSHDAYFLYTGDVLGYYWPSMTKTINLLKHFNFSGVDTSLFNGSSDLFLAPNFFACHPLLVAYAFLTAWKSQSPQMVGQLLVFMIVAHNFMACYFSLKLAHRFLQIPWGYAAFAALYFTFGTAAISAYGEPELLFCATMVPVCIYASLRFEVSRRLWQLPLTAAPVVITVLGGYIPLGMACLLLSAVTVGAYLIFFRSPEKAIAITLKRVIVASCPFLLGALIVSPYLLAVYRSVQDTSSAHQTSLFFSAQQLAELPQSIARILSFYYPVPGPFYEFSSFWGFIGITIAIMFLASPSALARLTPREWTILKAGSVVYFATLLSTFGSYSPVSTLVYYLVPQIGKMHIYQRFLFPSNLILGIMLALMLKALIQADPVSLFRKNALSWVFITLLSALTIAKSPTTASSIGFDNTVLYEMIVASLFSLSLLVPDTAFRLFAVYILWSLPSLNTSFGAGNLGFTLDAKAIAQPMMLDPRARAPFVDWLHKHSDKQLIKYFDSTPMWVEPRHEPFPKSFPYLVSDSVGLSSYDGFNFYLAPQADYMRLMPIGGELRQQPNWDWLRATGADFLIIRQENLDAFMTTGARNVVDMRDIFELPDGVVAVPLNWDTPNQNVKKEDSLFDNGYFKVVPTTRKSTEGMRNIAVGKVARQSSTLLGRGAALAVDGNTDGIFAHGSVTHTAADPDNWFEVDLGAEEDVDAVRVWNRTDCCQDRLQNYWTFISSRPFSDSASAKDSLEDGTVWRHFTSRSFDQTTIATPGVRGRYVRVQFGGEAHPGSDYLSLAEVQVLQSPDPRNAASVAGRVDVRDDPFEFATNGASRFAIDLNVLQKVDVEYQLWRNPRFTFYLDGRPLKPINAGELQVIEVPEGKHRVEVIYRNWPLSIFWLLYALYGLTLLASGGVAVMAGYRSMRLRHRPSPLAEL